MSSCAHVVLTTAKQVISSRRKIEIVRGMSKNEKCTCKACKSIVFHCQICKFMTFLPLPLSSWLRKLPNIMGWISWFFVLKCSFSNTPFGHKMESISFAVMGKSQRNYVLNIQVCFLHCWDSFLGFLLLFVSLFFVFAKNQHFFDLVLVQFAKMFETGEI